MLNKYKKLIKINVWKIWIYIMWVCKCFKNVCNIFYIAKLLWQRSDAYEIISYNIILVNANKCEGIKLYNNV